MPRNSEHRSTFVSKSEIVAAVETTHHRLLEMVGRWSDNIPAPVRKEIRRADRPLIDILLRMGRS